MRVVISTVGRFHLFALARELVSQGALERIYSGFSWAALARENVPREKVSTFPLIRPLYIALHRSPIVLPHFILEVLHELSLMTLDYRVSRSMPPCDIFVGHEGVGLTSGRAAKLNGAMYICDRGCTHMAWKEALLQIEYDRVGLRYPGRPRTYDREIAEYAVADRVVVPSSFAKESFVSQGIAETMVSVVPYGVRLEAFSRTTTEKTGRFQVLFVGNLSVRKGAHDLFAAFRMLSHPFKRLSIVGTISPEIKRVLADDLDQDNVVVTGHMPQKTLRAIMNASDVLVVPSIEEGMALVQAEALACGCPIVSTTNSGATDLITDGLEGFIVPIRSPYLIADRLQRLADDPGLRAQMSEHAMAKISSIGGWEDYGRRMISIYRELLA